jgi:hypothetical protein
MCSWFKIWNKKCYVNISAVCKCYRYRIVASCSQWWSVMQTILAGGYICTEPIYTYTTGISVHNRHICTQPTYLYTTGISVHSRYICTQPTYLYTTDVSVHNRYICTQPIYLYTTDISVHNRYICTQPIPNTPLNCTARHSFRASNHGFEPTLRLPAPLSLYVPPLPAPLSLHVPPQREVSLYFDDWKWRISQRNAEQSDCRTFLTSLVQYGDSYLYTDRQFVLKFFHVLTCKLWRSEVAHQDQLKLKGFVHNLYGIVIGHYR